MFRFITSALVVLGLGTAPALAAEPEFTLAATAAPLVVGTPGAIDVKVEVKPGFHWNDDYPATLEVVGGSDVIKVPKAVLKQLSGDFKATTPTTVAVAIPVVAQAKAAAPLTVSAKFSICNERVCLTKSAVTIVQVVAP